MKKLATLLFFVFLILDLLAQNVEYQKGDKVWVYLPKMKEAKFVASIWSTRYLKTDGYYEISFNRNTFRANPSDILGKYDPNQQKFKKGDKVSCLLPMDGWANGTITDIKDTKYIIDFEEDRAKNEGRIGIIEERVMVYWQYKEFFAEIEAMMSQEPEKKLACVAQIVCGACSPNVGDCTIGSEKDINKVKEQVEKVRKIVGKYQNIPDNGQATYTTNPALMAKVVNDPNIMASLADKMLKNAVQKWYNAKFITNLQDGKPLEYTKGTQMMWGHLICEDASKMKAVAVKHLTETIQRLQLSNSAESYLVDWDKIAADKKKQAEEEANKNTASWGNYKFTDAQFNGVVENEFGAGSLKILYRTADFLPDKVGSVIKGRERTGAVVYKKPNCAYWTYIDFKLYQEHLGNGKYGAAKAYYTMAGYTKPF